MRHQLLNQGFFLIPLLALVLPAGMGAGAVAAESAKLTEAEAKMFTMGANYERYMGRWSRLVAPGYIKFAGVKNGERVLDVGTGTGALASALESALPASDIVGIDPSAGFIGMAKQSAKTPRARFEIGDAQALAFKDKSFDHTMSLLVMNFVPDHLKAIGEMRRVTRPRGSISACVWDYNEGMQSLRYFWDEVVALDPAMEPKDERHMKLSREGQLGDLWKRAGLVNVQERPLVIEQAFSSFEDYWGPFLTGTGPGGAYVVSLTPERRAQLEARLRTRLLDKRNDGAFALKARVWCVRGEVPAPV